LNGKCRATKRDGSPCTLSVNGADGYCWAHSPANAGKRKAAASRAGRAKPSREIADLKAELGKLKADVLGGRVDRNDAAVVVQVCRALRDLIELERRVKATDELAAQIAELRERVEGGRQASL
jgi:phage I-like protein